jgi:hypothetical protein
MDIERKLAMIEQLRRNQEENTYYMNQGDRGYSADGQEDAPASPFLFSFFLRLGVAFALFFLVFALKNNFLSEETLPLAEKLNIETIENCISQDLSPEISWDELTNLTP